MILQWRKVVAWLLCGFLGCPGMVVAMPTAQHPIETLPTEKLVRIVATIHPQRFNTAQGDEARYHLIVWKGGTSANALLETPADDLAFHDALVTIGARPGNNLTMASWNKRHDPSHPAPKQIVEGSTLTVRLSWADNPTGIPIGQAFTQHSGLSTPHSTLGPQDSGLRTQNSLLSWRFGGNRDRWFNTVPLARRPGCLLCLYSCPSGKVSNRALSVHDYVTTPARFVADTSRLPPDGTAVTVTVRLAE